MRDKPRLQELEHVEPSLKSFAVHPEMGLLYANRQPKGTDNWVMSWKLDRLSAVSPMLMIVAADDADARNRS